MKTKTIRYGVAFLIIVTGSLGLLPALSASAEKKPVVIKGVFSAGTVGNEVVFEVRNHTQKPVHGVRMSYQAPQQYCYITGISPEKTTLKPGEAKDFTVKFSVIEDVPDMENETISLFFENAGNLKFDNRWYHIVITIKAEEEIDESKYDVAYFVVKVEGSGYTTTYKGETWIISGSATTYIQVPKGHSAYQALVDKHREIMGDDKCRRSFAAQGMTESNPGWPSLFNSGPKLTIVDGPYFDRSKFDNTVGFSANWQLMGKDGPDIFDIYCKKGGG